MTELIDQNLREYFQPERIQMVFNQYEIAKQDYFDPSVVKISMGADGISHKTFKKELEQRCAFISNRVLNGTYQFYPFREVSIQKPSGGERILSIATIRDILVQKLLYEALYNEVESKFRATSQLDRVSCAYRKQKSAPYAATLIHRYIKQGYQFALDADIVKFFERIPHPELFKLIEDLFGQNTLASKMLKRFINAGGTPSKDVCGKSKKFHHYKPNRQEIRRTEGLPQGGILSGMLANLYLHSFDRWIVDDLSHRYSLRYVRYADDFIFLLKKQSEIALVHQDVFQKLQDLQLELHSLESGKTRYVDIYKNGLDFVGFHFSTEHIKVGNRNIQRFKDRISEKIKKEQNNKFGLNSRYRLKRFIINVINRKIVGCGEEICSLCNGVKGEKVRSWIGFFSTITDVKQLHELDKWIRVEIGTYFWRRYGISISRADFRRVGLASLEQEYYKIYKRQMCKCAISSECDRNLTIYSNRSID